MESETIAEMLRQVAQAKQDEIDKDIFNHEKSKQYREDLHSQLEDLEERKKADFQIFLKEKAM